MVHKPSNPSDIPWSAEGFIADNRRVFGDNRRIYLRRKAVFLRNLDHEIAWWLEVGAGNGEFSAELVSQGCRVVLLDKNLELLRSYRGESGWLVTADATRLSFPDASVPGIFCSCLLHHLDDRSRRAFMKEVARILTPIGLFAVFEHNPLHPAVQWVVRRLPYDKDARLLMPRRARIDMQRVGIKPAGTAWLNVVPASLPRLEWLEKRLVGIPVGTQWVVWGRKNRM